MKSGQKIDASKARQLNTNYNAQRAPVISAALGKNDANAAWFSLQELEDYIEYIKSEADTNGLIVDGVWLYMGTYSSDETEAAPGMSTIFISPTGTREEDYDPKVISPDITSIMAYNFGSMGNPPQIEYGT